MGLSINVSIEDNVAVTWVGRDTPGSCSCCCCASWPEGVQCRMVMSSLPSTAAATVHLQSTNLFVTGSNHQYMHTQKVHG